MGKPKLIGLNVADNRNFRNMESFSYFYLHGQAQDINGYDCCVANIHAFWYTIRGTAFVADLTLTDGKKYKALVLNKIRMQAMEGLVVLIDDLDGLKDAFRYLEITHRISLYEHHKKEIIEKHPQTWKLLLTLK